MKAIRVHQFGDPNVLKLEDVPDPKPAAGQVLIRVKAAGVNPVETYIRAGWYGPKEFPYTPGNDAGGIIEAVGPGTGQAGGFSPPFALGARAYTSASLTGTYAELALCEISRVHPLPDHVTFQQGAAIGVPYGTAYRALFIRGGAKPGETVLVHGASGGVGTAAVQLAHAAKMIVIGTAGTEEGMKLVRENVADHVVNHRDANYTNEIMSLTSGKGVDIILEMLANVNLAKDLPMLAKRGRVVVIGSRGKVEIDPRDTMSRDSDIRGMSLGHADDAERKKIYDDITEGLRNRTLNPVIGKEFPLADAAKAHVAVMESGAYGKIVLIP